ncbi:MAG: ArsR family transcriptional regulator [Methanosphaera sp.]|uniref:ArsR family transcriptional regulator n=1 Tax=Methanosphaera sp. TaxID=2666342 RepID=UPI0025FE5297|nr:ArsR family transcriptional regulator [Methanosphaera sp.]MCI5867695.1 ArsR family transcriptional regulator [Methanosphaera sp.]MDD6534163.1 ArsR family transcriptional regulator [Methanosphaera sp.]MDY3956028.1 ArsR family transcriptional regulator [Methanosphaera sp.]
MIPINIYDNTKIKIYSTADGIKIVNSPIKIQILNMLDEKISEAEIVKRTGKSKSTISVHLKNLVDEGILSYKSHPLDRRSKLFYIYADYVGEVYPGQIIYSLPEVQEDIIDPHGLFTEVHRQCKGLLLHHGLELSPLETKAGERIGRDLYKKLEFDGFEGFLDALRKYFAELEIGELTITHTDNTVLKLKGCHTKFDIEYNISTCCITTGMIKGVFSEYYQCDVSVEEVECVSKYDDCCTFIVEKEKKN